MPDAILNPPMAFSAVGWDVAARLGGAMAAGLTLGFDREVRGYGAGMRSHGIVCFAASLLTVSSLAIFYQLADKATRIDPLRVIEGSATATGVIAAALIFGGGKSVRNFTTAVHLWLVAVIGIAWGGGLYPIALIGTAGAFVLLTVMRAVEDKPFGAHGDG